jgi:hypothetical protein
MTREQIQRDGRMIANAEHFLEGWPEPVLERAVGRIVAEHLRDIHAASYGQHNPPADPAN